MNEYTRSRGSRKFLAVFAIFFTTVGCSTVAKINLHGDLGAETPLSSTYSTPAASGSLDMTPAFSQTYGVGYLFQNVDVSIEQSMADFHSRSLDTKVSTTSTELFADYLFGPEKSNFPFAGVGVGSTATAFSGDTPVDRGDSVVARGGWIWRVGKIFHLMASAHYNHVGTAHVNRFYYFGGAGDIRHDLFGVEVGVIVNLIKPVPKQEPAESH